MRPEQPSSTSGLPHAPTASVKEFVEVLRHNFVLAMGGGMSVLATLAAAFLPKVPMPWFVGVTAVICGVLSAYAIWAKERDARVQAERRVMDAPNIQIAPAGFYADERVFSGRWEHGIQIQYQKPLVTSMLHLRLINEVHGVPSEKAVAPAVSARIYFSDSRGQEVFFMDGRWSDSTQPTNLQSHQSTFDLLSQPIGIGQIRELDIAMKVIDHNVAYGFNNDSYTIAFEHPARQLEPGDYTARVCVFGPMVNKEWSFRFRVGRGGERLQVLT